MSLVTVEGPDDAGVASLTLNRPDKRNALSIAVRDEMSDALDAFAADERCRVVVVTGAGDVFSLVSRVVQKDQVVATAIAVATEIAAAPRDVLAQMKAKILRRAGIEPGATLDL